MSIVNMVRICILSLLVSLTVRSLAASPPESPEDKLHKLLEWKLSPADLGRSRYSLAGHLHKIGTAAGMFDIRLDENGVPFVRKVRGGPREWVLILNFDSDDREVPCIGFWAGVRGHRVVATKIPDGELETLDGPIEAEWRRKGDQLIGAGIDTCFHSPNFAEGDVEVYRETHKGISLIHRRSFAYVKAPVRFVSAKSWDLVVDDEAGSYETLDGRRWTTATREIHLTYAHGRYKATSSRTAHDSLWAFDHLMTAVVRRHSKTVSEMVPNPAMRSKLVPLLRQAWHEEATQIDGDPDDMLSLYSRIDSDYQSPQLHFVQVQGKWIVRSFKP